jgi:hypothetical protein
MKTTSMRIIGTVVLGALACQSAAWAEGGKKSSFVDKLPNLKFWQKGGDDSSSSSDSDSESDKGKMPSFQGRPAFSNGIVVEKVKLSKENALAAYSDRKVSCGDSFTGTHAGNEIFIRAKTVDGDGKYTHTLVYNFGDSYEIKNKEEGQHEISRKGDGVFKVKIPKLKDNVPFVQQNFFLITRDSENRSVTTNKVIQISRPVILSVSADPSVTQLNCYQRYQAYESSVGVLSNGSTDSSHIEIRQGIEKIYTNAHGRQLGVYLNPTVGVNGILVSLLSFNYNYFSETSKQTVQSMDVTHKYELSPGDLFQVYVQPTRYVTAYDTTLVDACGKKEKLQGAYFFQWWGHAYHVYPVDPLDKERPLATVIGAPVDNTCSKEIDGIVGGPEVQLPEAGKL